MCGTAGSSAPSDDFDDLSESEMEDSEEGTAATPVTGGVSATSGAQPSVMMNIAAAAVDQLLSSNTSAAGLDLIADTLMDDTGGHLKRGHEDMTEGDVGEYDTSEL